MQKVMCVMFLVFFCVFSAVAQKKIIHCGWDIPNPEYMKENIKLMEKAPYDGISISLEAKDTDRKSVIANRHTLWQNWRWKKEWFEESIATLKAVQFKKFTDNFLLVCTLPGKMDMFDDEAWGSVTHNIGLMAEIAKECKIKGLIFDPEFYQGKLFEFVPDKGHSFLEYKQMSRKRGAQSMDAMTNKYPDMTLLTFFMLGASMKNLDMDHLEQSLQESSYGLFPAFVNGMLDAMPSSFTLIDGGEEAYQASCDKDFLQIYWNLKSDALKLVAPENKNKYSSQVQVGFGLWVDPYIAFMHDPKNNYRPFRSFKNLIAPNGMNQLNFLSKNLRSALKYSDKYVWDWCEYGRWWPIKLEDWRMKRCLKTPMKGALWEQTAPGITQAYNLARDSKLILESMKTEKKRKNLVKNSEFETVQGQRFPGWVFWQTKKSQQNGGQPVSLNQGRNQSKCVELKKVSYGSMIGYVDVMPGDVFYVEAWSKGDGISVKVSWKDVQKRKLPDNMVENIQLQTDHPADWNKAMGVVIVPDNAKQLSLSLSTKNPTKRVFFDDVKIYKLNDIK